MSLDGRARFEVAEKTGTSKGRKVEPGRVECIVWRVGGKRRFIELLLDARPVHIFLSFSPPHLTDRRMEPQGKVYRQNLNPLLETHAAPAVAPSQRSACRVGAADEPELPG